MNNKIYGIFGILLILGAAGVYELNSNNNSSSEPVFLKIKGTAGNAPQTGAISIAIKEGYLEEEMARANVKYELVPVATEGGSGAGELLGSGSIDIASWGEIPILHTIAAGIDISIIGIEPFGGSRNAIVVPNGSDIKSIKDLKGKKISSTYGGNAHLFWSYILRKNGLSFEKDVEFVNLPKAERKAALMSKQIDAAADQISDAVVWEKDGWAKIILDVNEVPEWRGLGVHVVRSEYGKKHPEAVKAYLKALLRAGDWIKEHPDEFVKHQSNISKLPVWVYSKQYPNKEYIQKLTLSNIEIDNLNVSKKLLIDMGLRKEDFDAASRVDRTYLEAAVKELENEKK